MEIALKHTYPVNTMIFDIDRELEEDDTSSVEPCMTMLLIGTFLAIFYQLVGNSMGSEL